MLISCNKPLYNVDDYSQSRQVRSKFHDPSTYLYCRASNTTTNDLRLRPITIWTLTDTDTNNATVSAGKLALRLLQNIARYAWNEQGLDYVSVNSIQWNTDSKMNSALCDICDLFKTSQHISILGNKDLNDHLTHLSDSMLLQSISTRFPNPSPYAKSIILLGFTINQSNKGTLSLGQLIPSICQSRFFILTSVELVNDFRKEGTYP